MNGTNRTLPRILALALASLLALSGCTGTGTSSGSSSPASGSAKQSVKIAFVGPLTGGNSRIGIGGKNSFTLALNERNAKADGKYKFEPVYLDDECKPESGVQVALKAGSDLDVAGAVAHYCSVVALATVDTWHKQGLATLVWGAVHPDITYANNFPEVGRVNGTQIQQNQFATEFAVKTLGYKKFAIIHDTTDYGRGHYKYFKQFAEQLGVQLLEPQPVAPDQQDFTAELTKIKAMDPEVVWFGGLTPVGIRIKTQMDKLGIKALFMGTSGIMNEEFNTALGKESAEGSLAFLDGAPADDVAGGRKFLDSYQKAGFAEPPEAYGIYAYVAANLIMDAVEKVGTDRAKVIAEVRNTKDRETAIGKVTFDDHGQNVVPLVTAHVSQDGKWVSWAKSEYAAGKRTLPGKKGK